MASDLLTQVESLPFAKLIAENGWIFPTLESSHVVALGLVVGSVMIMDLRLVGLARRTLPVTQVVRETLPWTWSAFLVAALTGSLMFVSRANDYWDNDFFRAKLILLALAGLNMAAFHVVTWRSVSRWAAGPLPLGAKLAGGTSLALWIGVVICGRWIGFV
jgi:hypothetical protein